MNSASHPMKDLQRADEFFTAGRFEEATPLYEALAEQMAIAHHVHLNLGRIALLADEQEACEFHLAVALHEGAREALAPLGELYRRRGQYEEAARCFHAMGQRGTAATLSRFRERIPYQLTASSSADVTLIRTDPLPVVPARVNGAAANFLLDTGAQDTVLDTAFAARVHLPDGPLDTAAHAGGKHDFRHSILDELRLGAVEIRNVPVQVQPVRETFSRLMSEPFIDGIIGTGILYHFQSELDLRRAHLSLAPRGSMVQDSRQMPQDVPLWLAAAHMPLVRIDINKRFRIPVLLDTGHSGFALTASAATAKAAGARPTGDPVSAQGGGGEVPLVPISLSVISLGSLTRWVPSAACMLSFPLEYRFGFHIGGLLSYDFFRSLVVRFDFDNMRLRFGV